MLRSLELINPCRRAKCVSVLPCQVPAAYIYIFICRQPDGDRGSRSTSLCLCVSQSVCLWAPPPHKMSQRAAAFKIRAFVSWVNTSSMIWLREEVQQRFSFLKSPSIFYTCFFYSGSQGSLVSMQSLSDRRVHPGQVASPSHPERLSGKIYTKTASVLLLLPNQDPSARVCGSLAAVSFRRKCSGGSQVRNYICLQAELLPSGRSYRILNAKAESKDINLLHTDKH